MSDEPDKTPEETPATPEEQAPPDAVLVLRIEENGNIATDVSPLGDVKADQVLTLLELGIDSYRAKVGLPKR